MEIKKVSIVMGSDSDMPVMKQAAEILDYFNIPYEMDILSAHRTPKRAIEFAENAHKRGIGVIIAGAGGAAHLPGIIASLSPLPVIGVPIKSSISIDGWDSILSILQMPGGIPVATVGLNAAKNAGILAAQIIFHNNTELINKILQYKQMLEQQVLQKSQELKASK